MKVSVAEARNDLTKLIKKAIEEHVIVTRRGKPAVVLVPYEQYERLSRVQAYLDLVQISEELQDSGIKAKELYEASRKALEERSP